MLEPGISRQRGWLCDVAPIGWNTMKKGTNARVSRQHEDGKKMPAPVRQGFRTLPEDRDALPSGVPPDTSARMAARALARWEDEGGRLITAMSDTAEEIR